MIKVDNRKCIRLLSRRSLRANRTRNIIAIVAIALTTVLFTSLFTIAGTVVNSFQQETFRQVGGDMHGSFKELSEEQRNELASDPLVARAASRLMLGMPTDPPFNKAHVEVSYMDEACAEGSFCTPEEGSLPKEGTDQMACDTRVLKLLGVEPKVGAKITLSYELGSLTGDPVKRQDTFTLSGWWEYDSASAASMVLVPRSYADEVLSEYQRRGENDSTGTWTLNVYLESTRHIKEDFKTILDRHGYQTDDQQGENFIAIGVNWAYVGAQLSQNMDPTTLMAMGVLLILIAFTGYLIIYNIFQISVANDIRFYGLLKTIGTTPRQIRRMVRSQALWLSVWGIPIGLVTGYLCGNVLTPVIMSTLSYTVTHITVNPLIFLGATAFSLVTVLISCRKPGRIAGKVSPVEAVRYTEGSGGRRLLKKSRGGSRIHRMALANLGRNKKKTVLVVLSLSLAVVLLQMTCMFTSGFDMDKYLRSFVVTDFVMGDAKYFQSGNGFFNEEQAVPEAAIEDVEAREGITQSARIYGDVGAARQFVAEERYRAVYGGWYDAERMESELNSADRTADGRVSDRVDLYGMEDFALDQLKVISGDLAPLYDPGQKAIAAVYFTDDYDRPEMDSNWAKVGDQVTIRYVDQNEYRDEVYTVAACVTMRTSMSYRYFAGDQFVLNAETFQKDSGTSTILNFLFDVEDEKLDSMDMFLRDYTENTNPLLDYESKQSYVDEFEGFRRMFLMLGGALSFIIGLVGVLNFLNAVLTSIMARKREFAVLQSIGMTGKQLKTMLVWEGVLYTAMAIGLSLILSLLGGPALGSVMNSMFWFFTSRFTILPVVAVTPIFLILGAVLPLIAYQVVSKHSIVERLREAE